MNLALGIDTGGTYTDAVLVDQNGGGVLAWEKSLTTYGDLSLGIGRAMAGVFAKAPEVDPARVEMVGLSTTLATNAITEGVSAGLCLVLIGYDRRMLRDRGLTRLLVTDDVVYLRGGHGFHGDQAEPLDEQGLREAVAARLGRVEAFAVSSYFAVKNPEHEQRAAEIIRSLCGLPVTCGHSLTSKLDSLGRATTVALNAGLVPLIRDLIGAVRSSLRGFGVPGRLMVVRGDGSLVAAGWAEERPIETILSGPAASVVGAWHLAGCARSETPPKGLWVVDMGGTTTDIAYLANGRPRLNSQGARVGKWRTMVEAVDVRTRGLGGDSMVCLDQAKGLSLGPRRVTPLCVLASQHPGILPELERQCLDLPPLDQAGMFLVSGRRVGRDLSSLEKEVLEAADGKPLSLALWAARLWRQNRLLPRLDKALSARVAGLAGFTPTDALHALGRLRQWDEAASLLGARILAAIHGCRPREFCAMVLEKATNDIARELVFKALGDEGLAACPEEEPGLSRLLAKALGRAPEMALACSLRLPDPVAGIGAPAGAYVPAAAAKLGAASWDIPEANVANAVGAVVGNVTLSHRAEVSLLPDFEGFRLHLPNKIVDFWNIEEAVEFGCSYMNAWIREQALKAGAATPEIHYEREDRKVALPDGTGGKPLYLGTILRFVAIGRAIITA